MQTGRLANLKWSLAALTVAVWLSGCQWPGRSSSPAPAKNCPAWNEAAARYLTPNDFAACSCSQLETLQREVGRGRNGFAAENAVRIANYQASAGCVAPTTTAAEPARRNARPNEPARPVPSAPAASRPVPPRPADRPVAGGYGCPVWEDAASRYLNSRDLQSCSCQDLDLLRNEVYARHGRIFNRQDLQNYFNAQSWYAPDRGNADGDRGQNQFERNNVTTILNHEKAVGCRAGGSAAGGGAAPNRPTGGNCPSWPAQADFRLGPDSLSACSCRELDLLRNEIYARHGRIFNRQDLQNYFNAQSWYVPDSNNINGDRGQNGNERANVTAILNHEKRLGCR